jgi:hypothetical protein
MSSATVEHVVEVPSPDIGEGSEKVVEKHPLTLALGRGQVIREPIEPAPEARCADSAQIRHCVLAARRHGLCPLHPHTAHGLFHT